LIKKGGRVFGMQLPAEERRFDIGNFESYFQAFCEFALADPRYGPRLRTYIKELLAREPTTRS
jgi:UTP--glucose-1-phosphate uridylyltransferase